MVSNKGPLSEDDLFNGYSPPVYHVGVDFSSGSDRTVGIVSAKRDGVWVVVWAGAILRHPDGSVTFPPEAFVHAEVEL